MLEVIQAVERVTGQAVPQVMASRRAGDTARLVACADRARDELGWEPRYSDLEAIVATAWEWHRRHPRGYGSEAKL